MSHFECVTATGKETATVIVTMTETVTVKETVRETVIVWFE